MPDNVLEVVIDQDIELHASQCFENPCKNKADLITKMPVETKGRLLTTITIAMKKYNCHWSDLIWGITVMQGQPIIKVKKP